MDFNKKKYQQSNSQSLNWGIKSALAQGCRTGLQGQSYAGVNYSPQSETMNLATGKLLVLNVAEIHIETSFGRRKFFWNITMREKKGPIIHTLCKLAKKQIEFIISIYVCSRVQRFYRMRYPDLCLNLQTRVFVKTSPKRSYSVIENARFGLVFKKTRSIISGTGDRCKIRF